MLYVCLLALVAASELAVAGDLSSGRGLALVPLFYLLYNVAELGALSLPLGTVSNGHLVLITAALVLDPFSAGIVGAVAALTVSDVRRGRGPLKILFNASQQAIYVASAAVVFRSISGAEAIGARWVLGALAAGTTALLLNTLQMAGVISIDRKQSFVGIWTSLLRAAPYALVDSLQALLASALMLEVNVLAGILILVPLVALRLGHRDYLELENAHVRTVRAIVRALELKDPYTRGHSENVADIAGVLARELEWDEASVRRLYLSSLLHDIGKVAVSGRLLAKPTPLTADEYRIIQKHPVLGANLAGEVEFLTANVGAILHHHERFDGRGYPAGLAADDIPLEARVLAVADTYDALTSDRPYRAALARDRAVKEISRVSGTHLDPAIVEVFLDLVERGAVPRRLRAEIGTSDAPIGMRAAEL